MLDGVDALALCVTIGNNSSRSNILIVFKLEIGQFAAPSADEDSASRYESVWVYLRSFRAM